jgi:hypothetical protein
MARDIKDIVGILMRILGGGEVLPAELNDLDFEAERGSLRRRSTRLSSSCRNSPTTAT